MGDMMTEKIAWGGFCNNRLHKTKEMNSGYVIYAIFPNKRTAKLSYEDVRRIEIGIHQPIIK